MLDIKFIRENPEVVKENIKKKFQEQKLPLVDEVIALDSENRAVMAEAQELRSSRNTLSKQVGMLMGQAKKDPSKLAEAEAAKAKVKANADRLSELEAKEGELAQKIRKIMLQIPNIIDPSVPIGPDDSCNVEVHRFGEPVVPDFEIPYHTQIMESFNGIDMDAAGRVSGNGFYYLMGDIARIHEGVLAYARDFMIGKGFIFCIPPFMIHGNVVEGVMSQTEMDAMMYKIEGEDLYLIGTSEHSMIGKFIDTINGRNYEFIGHGRLQATGGTGGYGYQAGLCAAKGVKGRKKLAQLVVIERRQFCNEFDRKTGVVFFTQNIDSVFWLFSGTCLQSSVNDLLG